MATPPWRRASLQGGGLFSPERRDDAAVAMLGGRCEGHATRQRPADGSRAEGGAQPTADAHPTEAPRRRRLALLTNA